MLFLAGLMGMILVGTTVFVGFEGADGGEDEPDTMADAALDSTGDITPLHEILAGDYLGAPLPSGDGSEPIGSDVPVGDWEGDGQDGGEDAIQNGETDNWVEVVEQTSEVIDFDLAEDTLVLAYDGAPGADPPTLGLEPDGEDPDLTHVLLNGHVVMSLHDASGITTDDIQLVPEASIDALLSDVAA
ncbi:hypothetical protein RXV86_19310 [Alisedimentitalea sp. MJ-SS2]|uniref:hypothetical protein n=1 Tax=Aliisedimentitalea sp. MJ-SS2 TaxID=3049795 RepID=UPI002912BC91|nr:hypothetical protein [Alisedimentitalea sp. MJ-SS2]MDU8929544.1 hypothetical protein [Alisedimentitalea sp. MJ-SS2]